MTKKLMFQGKRVLALVLSLTLMMSCFVCAVPVVLAKLEPVYTEYIPGAVNDTKIFSYSAKSNGQYVDDGDYLIYNEYRNAYLASGRNSSGGLNNTTNIENALTVHIECTNGSNQYKISTGTGNGKQYLSIGSGTADSYLTWSSSSATVAFTVNSSYPGQIGIKNTGGNYYLRAYTNTRMRINSNNMGTNTNRFYLKRVVNADFADIENGEYIVYSEGRGTVYISGGNHADGGINGSTDENSAAVLTFEKGTNTGEYYISRVENDTTYYLNVSASDARSGAAWTTTRTSVYIRNQDAGTGTLMISNENLINNLDAFQSDVFGVFHIGDPLQNEYFHIKKAGYREVADLYEDENGGKAASDGKSLHIEDLFTGSSDDDGKILTDKTVVYGADENGIFTYDKNQFSVTLSALGQSYTVPETEETADQKAAHPDVVFVIDLSGSMKDYTVPSGDEEITRAEATANALNEAIKTLYANDPETRIGIVGFGYAAFNSTFYLPLDKYTLPEGQTDYILWGGRNYVSSVDAAGSANVNTWAVRSQSALSSSIKPATASAKPISESSITRPSNLTSLATSNGVTYSAANYSNVPYVYAGNEEAFRVYLYNGNGYETAYDDENIHVQLDGSTNVKYRTYSYSQQTGSPVFTWENVDYMMSTNFLINSAGEAVKPTSYRFATGMGTFTQAGLQSAEDMFTAYAGTDISERVPAIILISDGIPTVGDANTNSPALSTTKGVTSGYGYNGNTESYTTAQSLSDLALYTIKTSIKVKDNLNAQYQAASSPFQAKFFTLGPGVNYISGQLTLDPNSENMAAAQNVNTTESSRGFGEGGKDTPSVLYNRISGEFSDPLDYVDTVDYSILGDLSSEEIESGLVEIASMLSSAPRPIKTVASTDGTNPVDILKNNASMVFTDVIGAGMAISGDPVVIYNNTNYIHTSKTVSGDVTTYLYDYEVRDVGTNDKYNLGELVVEVINSNGKQTVKWYIPSKLLPIIVLQNDEYSDTAPIRLVYKVGLVSQATGYFYTNSLVENEEANVVFTPTVGNPYYYDNSDGHSVLDYSGVTTEKIFNPTETVSYSYSDSVDENGLVTGMLGNNGMVYIPVTNPNSDNTTTTNVPDGFDPPSPDNDGKVMTDKTVNYMADDYNIFTDYAEDEFGIELSALSQSYTIANITNSTTEKRVHPDVVFVLDTSYSMENYNMTGSSTPRAQGMVNAVNDAIARLMANDPETRIGVVTYGSEYWANGLRLPLDTYTLPDGDNQYLVHEARRTMQNITVPDGDLVQSALVLPGEHKYMYYDGSGVSDEPDISKARMYVDSTGVYKYYLAGSTSPYFTGTINDNTHLERSGYSLLRTGNKYYIYNNIYTERPGTVTDTLGTIGTSTTAWSSGLNIDGRTYYIRRYSSQSTTRAYVNTSQSTTGAINIRSGYTGTMNGITFTNNNGTITYSYQGTVTELKTKTMSVPVTVSGSYASTDTFYSSAVLKDSNGLTVKETSTHTSNSAEKGGTYTQAGLKAAEQMFLAVNDGSEAERVPVIVLVTDGVPTFYNTDFTNLSATKEGTGQTARCTDQMGYLTIRTAMVVKDNVDEHYTSQDALFYSIGPGVTSIFGKTVLDPSDENLAACRGNTATEEQGSSVTGDSLRTYILSRMNQSELQYVDFCDWSIAGELSEDDLKEGFENIINNIASISRPVTTNTTTVNTELGSTLDEGGYVLFTDVLGDDIELRSNPVIRYNDVNYTSAKQGDFYVFSGTVTEPSTNQTHDLSGIKVYVSTASNGKQTLYWAIPAELVPVILRKTTITDGNTESTYSFISPISLVYKVGVRDFENQSGTFYTNDYDDGEVTKAEFTPQIGNPYYYDIVEDGNGDKTAVWKGEELEETVLKDPKVTDLSKDYVYSVEQHYNGQDDNGKDLPGDITVWLGNNGVISLDKAKFSYDLYLVDPEGNPVDEDGNIVTFDERVTVSDTVSRALKPGDKVTVNAGTVDEIVPDGYTLFNPDFVIRENYAGNGNENNSFYLSANPVESTFYYEQPAGDVLTSVEIGDDGIAETNLGGGYTLSVEDDGTYTLKNNGNTVYTDKLDGTDYQVVSFGGNDYALQLVDGEFTVYSNLENVNGSTCKTTIESKTVEITDTVVVTNPADVAFDSRGNATNLTDYRNINVAIPVVVDKAKFSYNLYLVDENGKPINLSGAPVDFDSRITMSETVTTKVDAGSSVTIDSDDVASLIPEGYTLYYPEFSVTDSYTSYASSDNSLSRSDASDTTRVYIPEGVSFNEDGESTGIYGKEFKDVRTAIAIVKIQIRPDTVVIDYGIPVPIHPLPNDHVPNISTAVISGIAASVADETVLNTKSYTASRLEGSSKSLTFDHGTATVDGNRVIYTPTDALLGDALTFYYEIVVDSKYYVSTITVIPAQNMYYEESFCTFVDGPVLKWEDPDDAIAIDALQAEDRPGKDNGIYNGEYDANNVYGYDAAYNAETATYSLGTAKKATVVKDSFGSEPYALFDFCGTGFDVFSVTDSWCGSVWVQIYDKEAYAQNPRCAAIRTDVVSCFYGYTYGQLFADANGESFIGKFNDDGTAPGSILYQSITNRKPVLEPTYLDTDGTVTEEVRYYSTNSAKNNIKTTTTATYYDADGKIILDARYYDDNNEITETATDKPAFAYAYAYAYGWLPDQDADSALYQVPVIRERYVNASTKEVLPYGTYTVKIIPRYSVVFDDNKDNSTDFYIDGIRIYDPCGTSSEIKENNKTEVENAYKADCEWNDRYIELRSNILTENNLFVAEADEGDARANYALFIDGVSALNSYSSDEETDAMEKYLEAGPDNELYLAKDQAVTFKLIVDAPQPISTLQLGMKVVASEKDDGDATGEILLISNTPREKIEEHSIFVYGSSPMYRDLTDYVGWVRTETGWETAVPLVMINMSETVVSLTNVKWGYDSDPDETDDVMVRITVGPDDAKYAKAVFMQYVYCAPEEIDLGEISAEWDSADFKIGAQATLTVTTPADIVKLQVGDIEITDFTEASDGSRIWKYTVTVTENGDDTFDIIFVDESGNISTAFTTDPIVIAEENTTADETNPADSENETNGNSDNNNTENTDNTESSDSDSAKKDKSFLARLKALIERIKAFFVRITGWWK